MPCASTNGGTDWVERHPELRIRSVYTQGSNFGYLEFDLGGRRYKVTRRMALKPTDLSKASKPWGW